MALAKKTLLSSACGTKADQQTRGRFSMAMATSTKGKSDDSAEMVRGSTAELTAKKFKALLKMEFFSHKNHEFNEILKLTL